MAESKDSIDPRSAIVIAGDIKEGISERIIFGKVSEGKEDGMPPNFVSMVSTGSLK